MLWGQSIKVYTDHKNLTRDALGLTSDRVYRWRLLLEEYAPEIVYIKGVHNTVVDPISRLDYDPAQNSTNEYTHATVRLTTAEPSTNPNKWKTFSQHWQGYDPKVKVLTHLTSVPTFLRGKIGHVNSGKESKDSFRNQC